MQDIELYQSIVAHRERFCKLSGVDYTSHFPPNLNPIPPKQLLPLWEKDYITMQEQMIYGDSLPFKEMIQEVRRVVEEINQIKFEGHHAK